MSIVPPSTITGMFMTSTISMRTSRTIHRASRTAIRTATRRYVTRILTCPMRTTTTRTEP